MLALDGMSSGREQAESPVAVGFGIKLGRVGVVRDGFGMNENISLSWDELGTGRGRIRAHRPLPT